MDLIGPLLMKIIAAIITAVIVAGFPFLMRIPNILKDLTKAIEDLKEVVKIAHDRMDVHERRLDVADQLFSDLAEKGISTRLIADGRQDHPKFEFKRRMKPHHES